LLSNFDKTKSGSEQLGIFLNESSGQILKIGQKWPSFVLGDERPRGFYVVVFSRSARLCIELPKHFEFNAGLVMTR